MQTELNQAGVGTIHTKTAPSKLDGRMIIARMERLPVARFHKKMLAINGVAWAFDSFDIALVTFVVTALKDAWQLSPAQMGSLLSVGLFGMFFGNLIAGYAADKFGRKVVFQWTMLIFSLSSLACALAPSFGILIFFRFLVGLGLGGESPVVPALLGEFSPSEHRGKIQGLVNVFWGAGWATAAALSFFIIPSLGWRWAFVAGALPAFFIFIIRRHLPESPRWLITKGREAEANEIVSKLEQEIIKETGKELPSVDMAEVEKVVVKAATKKVKVSTLFSGKYRKRTLMIWSCWFLVMLAYYGLFSWLPTLFVEAGHTMVRSFLYVLIMQIAYMPNEVVASFMMDKLGRKKTMVPNLIVACLCAIAYGWALTNEATMTTILIIGIVTSLAVSATICVLYTYTPELYPTDVRITAAGFATAVSRIGSMIGPMVIAFGLAQFGFSGVFGFLAACFLAAAVIFGVFGMETKGQVLEN
ncbi:MAG: MFS transporter [Dehalobacterium sp.]|jgi:putative MFS transporter